jgi:DNA-binding MarR family transcriptional regulator
MNFAQLLRVPFQALVAELHRRLAEAGYPDIRPAHSVIFAHVGTEGIRLGELAERAQLTKQLVTYLIDALESSGYVERVPDLRDGRARLVRLTERGRIAAEVGGEIIGQIEAEWSQALGETELRQLRARLEHLVGVIDNQQQ